MLPVFGAAFRDQWLLNPTVRYLNHGTVGAIPKRVLARQRAWQDTIEQNPAEFMLRRLVPLVGVTPEPKPLIREAARSVAAFLGTSADHFGFCRNVTSAINAVLRSSAFGSGDEVLVFPDTYGAVTISARAIAGATGANVVVADVANPHDTQAWHDTLSRALTARTRLVILDHVTSGAAAVLNLKPLIEQCHAKGARVLVDGAHAPGAIDVNIMALDCDYYAGNLHKWMWTPRSCGFLALNPARLHPVHAPVLSWGYDTGFTHELDWEGTYDPTPMLATGEALQMFSELSAERIRSYNHALAWRGYQMLSALSEQPYEATQDSTGTMASVFLPQQFGRTAEDAMRVRDWLWHEHKTEIHVSASRDRIAARISAQVYVDEEDIVALVGALKTWRASLRSFSA
jgi:isopenicillin-N epimerase